VRLMASTVPAQDLGEPDHLEDGAASIRDYEPLKRDILATELVSQNLARAEDGGGPRRLEVRMLFTVVVPCWSTANHRISIISRHERAPLFSTDEMVKFA
jgi:hypothetical protein